MGVSDAGAQSCAPASECVCSPASTLIHASSVVETDQGEAFEVQVLEVFGADIGATPGQSLVLPDATPFGDTAEESLVYVVDGEVRFIANVDQDDGTVDCDLVEDIDVETAVELVFSDDCDGYVRDNYTVSDDYCPTGACEATVGGNEQGFATFLGVLAIGLFARRRMR